MLDVIKFGVVWLSLSSARVIVEAQTISSVQPDQEHDAPSQEHTSSCRLGPPPSSMRVDVLIPTVPTIPTSAFPVAAGYRHDRTHLFRGAFVADNRGFSMGAKRGHSHLLQARQSSRDPSSLPPTYLTVLYGVLTLLRQVYDAGQ